MRLVIFTVVIGAAFVFDTYFNSDKLTVENTQENEQGSAKNTVFFISQVNSVGAKLTTPKINNKRFQVKSHDKYLQKYHQIRNYQVLKAELQTQTTPLILSYHYLVFQNYFFTIPDEVPLAV